jgi:hypothetical protein
VKYKIKQFVFCFLGVLLFLVLGVTSFQRLSWPKFGNDSIVLLLILAALSILASLIQGKMLSKILQKDGLTLQPSDLFFLPYSMNVWGYIIPFQGSIVYFLLFLKAKFDQQPVKLFAFYMWLFFLELSIDGVLGLTLILYFKSYFFLTPLFISMIFSILAGILFVHGVAKIKSLNSNPIFSKLHSQIKPGLDSVSAFSIHDYSQLSFLSIANTSLSALSSYLIIWHFELEVSFPALFLITVLLRISLLFKFSPGNIGFAQLASGGLFALLGLPPEIGVLISLWQQSIGLILSIPLGLYGTWRNRAFFTFRSILTSSRS